jgi:hypothetical protein
LLTNSKETPSLFLAGCPITSTSCLNCSVMVPRRTSIRVPNLCHGSARPHAVYSTIHPPLSAIGWAACGIYEYEFHLFGHEQICKIAGWQKRLSVCSSLGFVPAKQDVESFVNLIHRLSFERVKSLTPFCSDWIAMSRGVQTSALFFKRQLVHLHSIRTL